MREYKVLEIIDDETAIIDYGMNEGAKKGDKLRIVKRGDEIFDKNKSLGFIYMTKDKVSVVETFEKFSICKKVLSNQKNILKNPLQYEMNNLLGRNGGSKLNLPQNATFTKREYQTQEKVAVGDIVIIEK